MTLKAGAVVCVPFVCRVAGLVSVAAIVSALHIPSRALYFLAHAVIDKTRTAHATRNITSTSTVLSVMHRRLDQLRQLVPPYLDNFNCLKIEELRVGRKWSNKDGVGRSCRYVGREAESQGNGGRSGEKPSRGEGVRERMTV